MAAGETEPPLEGGGPSTTSAAGNMAPRKRDVDDVAVADAADSTRVGEEMAPRQTCAKGVGVRTPRAA